MRSVIASLLFLFVPLTHAQDAVDGFLARTSTGTTGDTLPYRLFVPDGAALDRPFPAIVYLHGAGGAGTDNLKQISAGNKRSTRVWTTRRVQQQYPAFVIAPQIPGGNEWSAYAALLIELLANLSREFAIDADRVYLVGQSLGGFGTWDLITKRPDLFAAAIPLCGGGDPAQVSAARPVAVWAFHGADDDVVPVERSRELVRALRAAGGRVKYSEYLGVGHDVWTRAFAEPQLPDWLFAQRRVRP